MIKQPLQQPGEMIIGLLSSPLCAATVSPVWVPISPSAACWYQAFWTVSAAVLKSRWQRIPDSPLSFGIGDITISRFLARDLSIFIFNFTLMLLRRRRSTLGLCLDTRWSATDSATAAALRCTSISIDLSLHCLRKWAGIRPPKLRPYQLEFLHPAMFAWGSIDSRRKEHDVDAFQSDFNDAPRRIFPRVGKIRLGDFSLWGHRVSDMFRAIVGIFWDVE